MKRKLTVMILAAGAMLGAWARTYTAADFGKVVCADGSVYATAADASSAGKTARAMIACVDGNYVLAIALADTSATGLLWGEAVESVGTWTADKAVAGGQWRMPSADDFKRIFTACQGNDYTNDLWDGMEYSWGNLQTLLSSAGGAQLDGLNSYWLSDETSNSNAYAYRTNLKQFFSLSKSGNWVLARPVLAFGAARTYDKVQLWKNGPYWAETNIGADEAWDSGYYFWWGDTVGYKRENDKWVASDGSSADFSFSEANSPTYNKDVVTLQIEGWITADGVLHPTNDAAHVQWGGGWRMPTVQDLNDLRYNKCDWIWTTTNGVNGYLVRGKDEYSSASIFLPCTGYGSGNSRTAFSTHGYYWSSVPSSWNNAGGIVYLSDRSNIEYTSVRYAGSPIRPVQDAPAPGDLAALTGDYTAKDGDVLFGTIGGGYKVSIADGATVTISNAVINGNDYSGSTWAGITCEGDATIVLCGTNTVTGFQDSSGIFVPSGKTLTIQGEGCLTASGGSYSAGIGSAYTNHSGNIVVEGGVVVANGGRNGAGIGGSYFTNCGDISIIGGTVRATGGGQAAGIGSGTYNASCGVITIGAGIVSVIATAWKDVAFPAFRGAPIGTGSGGSVSGIVVAEGLIDTTEDVPGGSMRTIRPKKFIDYGASGDCNVTFEEVTGTLTVSGTGAMADYTFTGDIPWFSCRDDIKSIVLEDGVTSVGLAAFHGCGNVANVTIPDSVTSIVGWSFYCCSNLTSVTLSDSMTFIGQAAFYGAGLTYMTIPASVTNIGDYAFVHCTALTDVYCYPNAADLTWGDATQDFMYDGTTKIHVKTSQLAAYQKKFPTINATFVGDLPDFLGEDFERGVMPDGWTCESNDSSYIFSVGRGDYLEDTGSHGGQYNAKLAHASHGVKSKLISPVVDLSGTALPTLNFWFINRSWAGDIDELAVYYRTSSETEWQLMTNFPSAHDSWTECTIVLENPTDMYQIAFEYNYGYGYGIGIDDVSIIDAGAAGEAVEPDVSITAGEYFKATLAELGYDVPTDGVTAYNVVAYGLPAGLKLKYNAAVTKKVKKGKKTTTVVEKPAKVEWWIEGVPTAALDYATNPPYLVITTNGVAQTLPLSLGVEAQEVTELPDLALGDAINEQFYLPGVTNGWTVSGLPTGLKYTAKLVTTVKKKGKKILSVTTNALPYSVYGKTTKAGLFTITAKKKAGAYNETLKFRVLVNPAPVDTAIFGDELTNIVTMAYVPLNWNLESGEAVPSVPSVPFVPSAVGDKVAKVAGLPTGLAFAAKDTYAYTNAKKKTGKYLKQKGQTIVGTPKKPGTYVVTFTKNVTTGTGKKKKTVAKTAQMLWTVKENDAELSLGFNEKGAVIESGMVGLSYGDLMAFIATSNATVKASGLPKGIALANLGDGQYAFTGFTAKAGTYLVTVTATLNGQTVRQRVALKVDGLPSWAKGTYNGVVYATSGDLDYAGYGTVSVSSAGKISGKFSENGTNWTFSASSYDFYTDKGGYDGDTEIFQCTNVVAKYAYKVTEKVKGKKKTVTKYLTRNYTLSAGNLEVSPGVMRGTMVVTSNGDDGLVAYQNVWGQSGYKALGKNLFYTSKKVPCKTWSDVDAKGLTDAMSLSVKVTSAGVLTATMTFDTGKTTTDKKTKKKSKVYYKATCTTVLIPLSAADADPFKAGVSLYFAPSAANNFPGFCAEVEYPFAKRVAPQPGMANNWFTGEFTGYGDAQFPIAGTDDYDILNGLFTFKVASDLSFTGTFTGTDGTNATFSGTFVKRMMDEQEHCAASGVEITIRGRTMAMQFSNDPRPYAGMTYGFGKLCGSNDAEPGEPCIVLNGAWQNIWKRSDLAAEWKPAFATGTEKTIDLSETWLDGLVDSDTLTYAFGANGAVEVSGQIYGESVSATAMLDLEGYDESTNTMHCNFFFLANGHLYQQQFTFPRTATVAAGDISFESFVRLD